MYDSDKVRTDINLLSWYLRHPTVKSDTKIEDKNENVETGKHIIATHHFHNHPFEFICIRFHKKYTVEYISWYFHNP